MFKVFTTTIIIVFTVTFNCFSVNNDDGKDILMTVDGRNITKDEFLRIYHKNNNIGNVSNSKSVDEYMDLFINFKLKVIEAENLGMDTVPEFMQEYEGYVNQLAKSYTYEQAVIDSFARDAYEKKKTVVNICMLYLTIKNIASPADTMLAFNKINDIRQRILDGENFEKIAYEISEDPNVKTDSGFMRSIDFTKSPYVFENEMFNTKVGEMTAPIRSGNRYYLIKVLSRIPSPGKIKVAQIFIKTPLEYAPAQLDSAKNAIYTIYDQIVNGADFAEMAMKYSDDSRTAANGGELNYFEMGRMIPEFESTSFALQNNGDVSKPVKTVYGWHIIKRIDKQDNPLYETMREDIIVQLKKSREVQIQVAYINKLKNTFNLYIFKDNLNELIAATDPGIYSGIWNVQKAPDYIKPLFSYDGDTLTQYDLIKRLNASGYAKNKTSVDRAKLITDFMNQTIIEILKQHEIDVLYEKNSEFRYIVNEYHDGILLFNLTEKNVWSKSVQDSIGLVKFYNENSIKYMWNNRVFASIYTMANTLPVDSIRNNALHRTNDSISIDEFIKRHCPKKELLCISIQEGFFEPGDEPILDQFEWKVGISENKIQNDTVTFVVIDKILPPSQKTLEEAKGNVIADYQNYLENEWIQQLRQKYPITVNQKVLNKIKKEEGSK